MLRGLALLLLLTVLGCQPAGQFEPVAPVKPADAPRHKSKTEEPLSKELAWRENLDAQLPRDVAIEFVTEEGDRATWEKLPKYWNDPPLGAGDAAATLLMLDPLTAAALSGEAVKPVRIKLPRGLPDPKSLIPSANPPTLAKWNLGKQLFFDDTWLTSKPGTSCASCHQPSHHFADAEPKQSGYHAPSLVNVLYNRRQFWDGRVKNLEEVVQRVLDDELVTTKTNGSAHVWGGVIRRLQEHSYFRKRFAEVYGTPPTQDTLGRALATYLRTLLAGDSLYDRAVAGQGKRGGKTLEAADFEATLNEAGLKALDRSGEDKARVAAEVYHGYRLFFNQQADRKTNCMSCHSGALFTDQGYHNIGVGFVDDGDSRWPYSLGRFAHAPIGERKRDLIGAWRTPSLRGLGRTKPYLHTGEAKSIEEAIRRHGPTSGNDGRGNPYLDPLMKDGRKAGLRELGLREDDIKDLKLFLLALNGESVDAMVAKPPPAPK